MSSAQMTDSNRDSCLDDNWLCLRETSTMSTQLTDDGSEPDSSLLVNAKGDLFGTTSGGGPYRENIGGGGTVFELVKTGSGYTEKVLHSFNGTDGDGPEAGLLADAEGDLFGTTSEGGAYGERDGGLGFGTVFELAKTGSGYTEKVLHSFRGGTTDGAYPNGLIADAKGDLFGTTWSGGAYDDGTVFALVKTGSGYAEKVLYSFSGGTTDGANPGAGLLADAKGDLFGTTRFGARAPTPTARCSSLRRPARAHREGP
jgi:uncharacterized repeat protein (TIGR03803 family)